MGFGVWVDLRRQFIDEKRRLKALKQQHQNLLDDRGKLEVISSH